MKFPNKYLRNLKPYKVASHKIWSVSPEEREDILKLDWNESTVPPSPKVKEMLLGLMDQPSFFHLYPTTKNDLLLELISAYIGLPVENVQYFASSDTLHEYICKVFISVGDPVLILGPSYDNFRLTCQANGAEVYYSIFNEDFSFSPASFEEDINNIEPAVVYICNPNNPTGYCHSVDYLEHLLISFPDTLFLIDEAYSEFSGVSAKNLVSSYDNILISRTLSKAFGIANFRVGYLIASKDNVQFINKVRNPKNINTFAQTAAIAVLKDLDYMRNYVSSVEEAKRFFISEITKIQSIKVAYESAGNFLLLKLPSKEERQELIRFLADRNIFVRETSQHPMLNCCFRITVGIKEQMIRVIGAIQEYYGER